MFKVIVLLDVHPNNMILHTGTDRFAALCKLAQLVEPQTLKIINRKIMTYQYRTRGTCSQMIEFEIDEQSIIRSVQFYGGCQGNTQGLSALLRGMAVDEATSRLSGIQCGMKGTSCPDQFARALRQWKEGQV